MYDSFVFLGSSHRAIVRSELGENHGQAALDALKTYRPSVVFLDIGMPGMDGYEIARQARQQPEGRDVTLVALTGWGLERIL